MHLSPFLASVVLLLSFGSCFPAPPVSSLRIPTSSGIIGGFLKPLVPNVRQFLGVPFALPPIGSRRWLPPAKAQSNDFINASSIGPACPQLTVVGSGNPFNISVYSELAGNQTEFFPPNDFSEDCLTLNVWAPGKPREPVPVIVWFFGGGFTQGGTNSLYFNPESWIERSQTHIVVSVNFRTNILGFPNSPDLDEQNLGLLDQRLALEWIRDNIARFGGDPTRMISWGESSGAIGIDFLDLAYPSDPIIAGKILDSTTALFEESETADLNQTFFPTVMKAFNCSSIDCMRNVSWQAIETYLEDNPTLQFTTIPDGRIVFSNTTQRYEIGAFSLIPAIIGTNLHEPNALDLSSENETQTDIDKAANVSFLCTSAHATQYRESFGRTTYRYMYSGNFSNISPADFSGAYHASEIPLVMGTAGDFHGESTSYEDAVSVKMQDLWVAFAKDPMNGLRYEGWGSYGDGKAVVLGGGEPPMMEIGIEDLDGICP